MVEALFDYNAPARMWLYDGAPYNLVDRSSLMVSTAESSVEAMEEFKKVIDKLHKEKTNTLPSSSSVAL